MAQQAFLPDRVEDAGARFERHLFLQGPHLASALRLITDVNGRRRATLGTGDGAADAAQCVDILIDGCDAELDAFQVLIGAIYRLQRRCEQPDLAHWRALDAIGIAFLLFIAVGELIRIGPAARIDEQVDVRAIGALGIRIDPQRRGFEVATMFAGMGQAVLADKVHRRRLIDL